MKLLIRNVILLLSKYRLISNVVHATVVQFKFETEMTLAIILLFNCIILIKRKIITLDVSKLSFT